MNITAKEFLRNLFLTHTDDELIYVGGPFKHNPAVLRSRSAAYTTNCTFYRGPDGELIRQGAYVAYVYAIVLDDIGTKIPDDDRLDFFPPSYRIETSKGNYQLGYFLDEPLTAIEAAELLYRIKMLERPISDPGVLKVNQLIRLPAGINGKMREGVRDTFEPRIVEWAPENAYDAAEFERCLDLPELGQVVRIGGELRSEEDVLSVAEIEAHPLLALSELDVIGLEPGLAHITCPNVYAHSAETGARQTSLFFDRDGGIGFHCFHASCVDYNFMGWAEGQGYDPLSRERSIFEQLAAALPRPENAESGEFTADPVGTMGDTVGGELIETDGPTDWLLANITPLATGGYFDWTVRDRIHKDALNTVYGHLTARQPSVILANDRRKEVAYSVGWYPEDSRFFTQGARRYCNTYIAPQIPAQAGDVSLFVKLMQHVYGEWWQTVIQHMAYTLRYPGEKIRWQVLCYGRPRTGKTLTTLPLMRLFDGSALNIETGDIGTGWGDYWAGHKVLVIEEVWNGDRRFFNDIKTRFANSGWELLNIKGKGTFGQWNRYSIYLFTNRPDALKFDADEDKLLVIKGPDDRLSPDFYSKYAMACRDSSFIGAVRAHLEAVSLENFTPHQLPARTDALADMLAEGEADYVVAFWDLMDQEHAGWCGPQGTVDLLLAVRMLREAGWHHANRHGLQNSLRAAGYHPYQGQVSVEGKKRRCRFWAPGDLAAGLNNTELYRLHTSGAATTH